MKYLIDTSVLVEAERQNFDLGNSLKGAQEVWICDATVTEFLAGEPIKDPGKAKRWREFWQSLPIPSKPLTRAVCEQAGSFFFLRAPKAKLFL